MKENHLVKFIFLTSLLPGTLLAEWSGNITLQNRYFPESPSVNNLAQHSNYVSVSTEPEYYSAWGDGNQSITLTPFFRYDNRDDERSHADVREFAYLHVFDSWELRMGISKVYWGVTESQHLVDVINQTDNVENIDGEDKLGQPMIMTSIEKEIGTFDIFILPYFRERTFQGLEGRPRSYPYVDTEHAIYESPDEEKHIDFALRWFKYFGDIEFGISHFTGTSREPVLTPGVAITDPLIPYYPLISQTGIDIQYTTEEWLWKLEIIHRDWEQYDLLSDSFFNQDFIATTGGFEYTFVGIADSDADLGLVMEYLYDDRNEKATTLFQNDLMIGFRLAMNDESSSEALLGMIYDLDNNEMITSLEAEKRLSNHWKAGLEVRLFKNISAESNLNSFSEDSFIQLDIAYHF